MRIYVDRSSVEVFGNDGRQVITDIILPDQSSKGLEVYASNGFVKLNSMTVHPLKSMGSVALSIKFDRLDDRKRCMGRYD